jgi:RNA polymerase sigma factor (sigma-70 family)
MWRARSSVVQPTAGFLQPIVKVRTERRHRIGSSAARKLTSHDTVPLRDTGNNWAVVQQAIAGNAFAQERLFAHHSDRLYRTAFSVLRNKEDAEDAVQDGLCKAYSSLRSFQGRSSFSTWLTRIVINSALMIRRKRGAHPEDSLEGILERKPLKLPGVIDTRPNPEKICAAIKISALVEGYTSQLPPLLRAAFRLRARSEFSTRESSRALGITTGAFKSRISRARRKLAQRLQQSLMTKTTRKNEPKGETHW